VGPRVTPVEFVAMTKGALALLAVGLLLSGCGGKATGPSSTTGAAGSPGPSPTGGLGASGGEAAVIGGMGGRETRANDGGSDAVEPPPCETYRDCPDLDCSSCAGTPGGCPPSDCVSGRCFHPSCSSIDACYGKQCGEECEACYADDGNCTAGVCDLWGDCKEEVNSCDGAAPRPCSPVDAVGAGFVNGQTCNVVLGWGWGGTHCVAIVGCVCQGSDCRSLLQRESDCSGVFLSCRQG
jgi:hypothetical protein